MRALLLLSLFVLCGCPQDNRPEPLPPDVTPTGPGLWPDGGLELFTTDDVGEDLIPIGPTVEVHRGPQGGFHIYAKYRVSGGLTARDVVFSHRVRRARDGLLVSRGDTSDDVLPRDGGVWSSSYGRPMFLCPTAAGVNLINEPLSFEAFAKDSSGRLLGVTAPTTATITCTGCQADCGG